MQLLLSINSKTNPIVLMPEKTTSEPKFGQAPELQ
jgi:hypothetical protein